MAKTRVAQPPHVPTPFYSADDMVEVGWNGQTKGEGLWVEVENEDTGMSTGTPITTDEARALRNWLNEFLGDAS